MRKVTYQPTEEERRTAAVTQMSDISDQLGANRDEFLPSFADLTSVFGELNLIVDPDEEAEFIEANMPRLECLIGLLQDRAYELAQLQYRARVVRDRHEPAAEKRVRTT